MCVYRRLVNSGYYCSFLLILICVGSNNGAMVQYVCNIGDSLLCTYIGDFEDMGSCACSLLNNEWERCCGCFKLIVNDVACGGGENLLLKSFVFSFVRFICGLCATNGEVDK